MYNMILLTIVCMIVASALDQTPEGEDMPKVGVVVAMGFTIAIAWAVYFIWFRG